MVTAASVPVFAGPLNFTDTAAVATLRAVLERHGFTGTAVGDALGAALPFGKSNMRDDMPLYLRRVAAPTPINTLIKLFVLDRSVDESRAAAAFAPLDLDDVRAMGLIEDGPRGIRARLRLSVHDGLILAHDACDEERWPLRPDHVLDVNPSTITLSSLIVRRRVDTALEIGTGCGVLALMAARHATRVVATDTNPRALNLAAFNAVLNAVTNVEWRQGSLFDAVADERFDLIFSNPPEMSPDSQLTFRDGGRRGDALCEEIVRRAPEHLNVGGFLTLLVDWGIRHGEEWSAALRRWVEGNGCDTWLMLSAAEQPLTYAATWNRSRDRETYTAGIDRWTQYFDELGLREIGVGAVVLRRSTGASWVRADHLPDSIQIAAGHHIERLFEAEDRLIVLADSAAMLAAAFTSVPDHVLQQTRVIGGGGRGYSIEKAEVRLTGGLPFCGNVDGLTIQLLERCTGERSLQEVSDEIAAANGVDPVQFSSACAAIARRLLASGFLIGS